MKAQSRAHKPTISVGRHGPSVLVKATKPKKLTAKIGERGQVVIPKRIREQLAIEKNTEIEFELRGNVLTLKPTKDMAALRRHLEKWKGSMAGHLQRDGYKSVDDYMRVMRSR